MVQLTLVLIVIISVNIFFVVRWRFVVILVEAIQELQRRDQSEHAVSVVIGDCDFVVEQVEDLEFLQVGQSSQFIEVFNLVSGQIQDCEFRAGQ